MKRIELGQAIGVLANLAVLVGVLLLVLEIRQNTQALQNEVDVAITSIGTATVHLVADNAELSELLVRARTQQWGEFSPVEQFRVARIFDSLTTRFELQFRLYQRNGEQLQRSDWVFPEDLLRQQSFKTWWQLEGESNAHPDFRDFMDVSLGE